MDIPGKVTNQSKEQKKYEELYCPFCGQKNNESCYNLDCITIHARNAAVKMMFHNKSRKPQK